jgi:hypothetical protein
MMTHPRGSSCGRKQSYLSSAGPASERNAPSAAGTLQNPVSAALTPC